MTCSGDAFTVSAGPGDAKTAVNVFLVRSEHRKARCMCSLIPLRLDTLGLKLAREELVNILIEPRSWGICGGDSCAWPKQARVAFGSQELKRA